MIPAAPNTVLSALRAMLRSTAEAMARVKRWSHSPMRTALIEHYRGQLILTAATYRHCHQQKGD
jgi:hypothetical protein